ncbi:MAG: glycosyltransferase [Salibacteraceae bacterium]
MSKTKKIRVLRIINRFNLGGPTFNVSYLTKHLDDRFETKLLGGEKDESEASSMFILDEMNIKPHIISQMKREVSLMADLRAYQEIVQVIKEFKPHIVHTHASKSGALGRLAAIHQNVPVVLHTFHGHVFHSYFGALKTNLYKVIERYLARKSTRIIAISNTQKQELGRDHAIAPLSKIEVVPLGFDLSKFHQNQAEKRRLFRDRYKLRDNDVAIGIIGRLVPIKNHQMFLNAVNPIYKKYPNARFFVVGDGELTDELKTFCDMEGIPFESVAPPSSSKPLCFTSWIKEIDEVMAGLDIITLTSLNEGTPVSLIEAQSAGKPIVSTRVGGVEDIVMEGESALLCDKFDQSSFIHQLDRLVVSQKLRIKMGEVGREHVRSKFSYNRLVDDIQSLYLRLLQERNILLD